VTSKPSSSLFFLKTVVRLNSFLVMFLLRIAFLSVAIHARVSRSAPVGPHCPYVSHRVPTTMPRLLWPIQVPRAGPNRARSFWRSTCCPDVDTWCGHCLLPIPLTVPDVLVDGRLIMCRTQDSLRVLCEFIRVFLTYGKTISISKKKS